jgi:hypothetical protein
MADYWRSAEVRLRIFRSDWRATSQLVSRPNCWEGLRSDETAADGDGSYFDPTIDTELGEETGYVRLNSARADPEGGGDFAIVVAGHEQTQYIQLTWTQISGQRRSR